MPIALSPPNRPRNGLTKFTNCRLVKGDALVTEDLWVSSTTGTVINSQATFFDELNLPDRTIDLGGRVISPGMIECQLNGAFGFNFSTLLDDMSQYGKKVNEVNKLLVQTGVTSYIPTVTSQRPELYQKVLPFLGPSGANRDAHDGAESLGAHCEGPFLNPTKNGVHNVDVLIEAQSFADIEACYGADNLRPRHCGESIPVRMITAAPERGQMMRLIPEIASRGIIYSIGHSEATYEEASEAVGRGATMITHLFNAMRPLHHRNPGIFGVLGKAENLARPYFGIISDGIHLHPTTIKIAFNAHPDGFILVTDAMHLVGLPDGAYPWTNGEQMCNIVKKGSKLLLENSDTIAGSSITLLECVNNFLEWSGTGIPQALKAVTSTPAAMLGLQGIKGSLDPGADADLVIFSEQESVTGSGSKQLVLDEVWKFGSLLHTADHVKTT
ncbi:N-acetylglucosamine-6-phosphate deacetylase [Metarhizium album ARSEF 1941]|uniref:N-acetylglucosamine-6-phosphate deacetylase n=1 Tax=Metarhizium album (strain ARSEF 1941) TaxID=1081103 RepID=A0A0B2X5Y3_METAS|nr:N-acetylglucosamine-6-phosphate deacetylase [Metarhizium album ARSEF 1941]KHO01759.1 N-acetylglucosamine-6-phosphate deacetylase [Metarhizium album ARSEF 1941]